MTSIINEFKVFNTLPENIKQNIKLFHVFRSDFAICVTNDDKVYAFGEEFIRKYLGYKNEQITQDYLSIIELSDQNIENFFCFNYYHNCFLFARSFDCKIFGSGYNYRGRLARGYVSYSNLKPKRIEFFDNKNIIDISCGYKHCLALSSEGLVYGWGDNSKQQFDNSGDSKRFLNPVLINSEFGVEERVKHIHCFDETSVLVTFDSFVYILNLEECHLKYQLAQLSDVYKLYLNHYSVIILKNDGIIEYFSETERKTIEANFESSVNYHYFQKLSNDCELMIDTNEGIITIDVNNEDFSQKTKILKHKKAFEYCLFAYQSTFTTIQLKDNDIHYKFCELDENKNNLIQLLKRIDFNVKEYSNKYHNPKDSKRLKKFRIFSSISEIMESKVKLYHQIGEYSSDNYSGLFMNDNKVYAIGCNNYGILGLGHSRYVYKFTLIEELCDQDIEEFYEGGSYIGNDYPFLQKKTMTSFMFARNNKNQIFSWGSNYGTQLSGVYNNNNKYGEFLKPIIIEFFENKNIIEISCGFRHCLGLTEEGVLYGWGDNEYAQIGSKSINELDSNPTRIELNDSENRIKFIHCCDHISCAVTVDGRAFIWGQISGRKTVIPILIETNVLKVFLNSSCYFSILKMNGKFKFKRNNINKTLCYHMFTTKTIFESDQVNDIQSKTILKEDGVYEVNELINGMEKTNYSNFYEYFLYEKKEINETIHITSDGYLMRQTIEMNFNENSNEKLLKKTFVNIFDQKIEKCFDIIEKIGEGAFGVVFKAKSKSRNKFFAIKRIQIRGELKETLREIKFMSELNSEYIVKYYDSWIEAKVMDNNTENYVYIQMELCSQNLESIIELIKELYEEKFETIKYFIRSELLVQIIECINYLHSKNIIHRDLKPQNILITEGLDNRFLKLCDFGLSKIYENSQNSTNIGTLEYMAPEVRDCDPNTGKSPYNLKSDIFSIGIIATKIFGFKKRITKLNSRKETYFSNTKLNKKFSTLLEIISLMLSKKPEERLSCSELLAKTQEWTVDTNTIKSDENYEEFISVTKDNKEVKILRQFLIDITN